MQIYTGNGKGKTTAAFGLALRAAGHGNKVLVCQFLKPPALELGERASLRHIENITLELIDQPWDMRKSFDDPHAVADLSRAIAEMLGRVRQYAEQRIYDVIVLDEIVFCLAKGLVQLGDIKRIIEERHRAVEIVLTGRDASEELIDLADLVIEMKSLKHPFDKNIGAREGIEY